MDKEPLTLMILVMLFLIAIILSTNVKNVSAASHSITAKVVVTGNVVKNETKTNETNIGAEEKDFIRTIIDFIKEIFLKIF